MIHVDSVGRSKAEIAFGGSGVEREAVAEMGIGRGALVANQGEEASGCG